MKKEKDIFEIYNEMDELLKSVNLDNKKMPEMSKVFFDEKENPIVYKEKSEEEKQLIKNIEKEEKSKEELKEIKEIKEEVITEKKDTKKEKKSAKVKNKKEKNKKKKIKRWVITFAILDVIAIVCLFLMYGPISYFRNLWVTSAMYTRSHQYLAYIFFNQEQIDNIMASNTIIEVDDETKQEEITFEEQVEYSSFEEEQILKRDEGNDLYKVIEVEGNGYVGHLLVVYDPSKIQLVQSPSKSYGLTIEQFVEKNNAVAGINAGGFSYSPSTGYSPLGALIVDGNVISTGVTSWGGGIVGFTEDNVLVLTKASAYEAVQMGVRDAVSFGPFLIVNGVASEFKGNGGYGVAPRTAIGQRKDGIVLMLVIDGRRAGHSLGVDMVELTNIMLKYGAYNASNLDGGGSSTIVVNGETLSVAGGSGYSGDRYLPNSWIVER